MRHCTLVVLCTVLLCQSASAAPIPAISVEVGELGSEQTLAPGGVDNGDGTFDFDGNMIGSNWELEWDMTVDPDPFVSAGFTFTNTDIVTKTFVVSVSLPIAPPIPGATLVGGSIGLTVTDANFDGVGTVSSVTGTPIYLGTIDGGAVLPLLPDPSSVSVPFAGGSAVISDSFGLPGPTSPGPAALTSIGIEHTFTLTPGDRASLTSFFVVVPEPGSVTLAIIGGFCLVFCWLRRR